MCFHCLRDEDGAFACDRPQALRELDADDDGYFTLEDINRVRVKEMEVRAGTVFDNVRDELLNRTAWAHRMT